MRKVSSIRLIESLSALVLAVSLVIGCNNNVDPDAAVAQENSTNLERVSNLYLAYQMENNWVGPPDEAKFKEFIRKLPTQVLTRIAIDPAKLDEVFVSERDSQPFKIRWSVVGHMMGSTEPVVFESEGIDGMRQVGSLDMSVREVGPEEYEQLFAGKGAIQASTRQ